MFNMMQQDENHMKIMIARDNQNEVGVAFAARELNSAAEESSCKICG